MTGEVALDELRHGDGAAQLASEVVVEVTIHDLMAKNQSRGAGRHYLWKKSLEICRQRGI